jgi:DNA-binding beta-propeller fold protein YncE|tara:strand:- start:878 stop:1774 length:897 start_codon:yes stop_codon:yes gene_type:complete
MKSTKAFLAATILLIFAGGLNVVHSAKSDGQAAKTITLTQSWQSVDGGLNGPESVIHDSANQVIYAANINPKGRRAAWKDNGGFISKLGENGAILEKEWATGLKAPKGMALNDGNLYVADLNTVAVIDTATGDVLATYTAPEGSDRLNDLVFDPSIDTVYVSDSAKSVIYKIDSSGVFSVFYDAEKHKPRQGGLYLDGDNIIMSSSEGSVKSISIADNSVSTITEGIDGRIDGIWKYDSTGFFVSDWRGTVYFVGYDGVVSELISTDPERSADISYSGALNKLLVPNFKDKIIAYAVN